jgi:hypothetical protein
MPVKQGHTEPVEFTVACEHVSHVSKALNVSLIQLEIDLVESWKLIQSHGGPLNLVQKAYNRHSARAWESTS